MQYSPTNLLNKRRHRFFELNTALQAENCAFGLFLTTVKNSQSFFLTSQELVDDLYNFREHYFETHSVEDAGRKQNDVAQEMEKTLKKLEEKEGKGYIYTTAFGPF